MKNSISLKLIIVEWAFYESIIISMICSMWLLSVSEIQNSFAQLPNAIPEIEMVEVKGGTFTMGSDDSDELAESMEKPKHTVTLDDFHIGKYEVSQKLWETVMGDNPSVHEGGNLPVTNISWNDVQVFITRLNKMTKKKYRLPTEAEWEFAARGGISSKEFEYIGSNDCDSVAWHFNNSEKLPHEIGLKKTNELGIYDMGGNVQEWVNDNYGRYDLDSKKNPTGAKSSDIGKIIRGGSYALLPEYGRPAYRCVSNPSFKSPYIGFRLAQ